MNATENVSQDTIPWSISSTKAVRVKDSMSPKLENTGRRMVMGPSADSKGTRKWQSFMKMRTGRTTRDCWYKQLGHGQTPHKPASTGRRWVGLTEVSQGLRGADPGSGWLLLWWAVSYWKVRWPLWASVFSAEKLESDVHFTTGLPLEL